MGRPRKNPRKWYRCVVAFGGMNDDGTPNDCSIGTLLPEDDPRVKGNPRWFVPVDPDYPGHQRVEQATAAPGERREEVS